MPIAGTTLWVSSVSAEPKRCSGLLHSVEPVLRVPTPSLSLHACPNSEAGLHRIAACTVGAKALAEAEPEPTPTCRALVRSAFRLAALATGWLRVLESPPSVSQFCQVTESHVRPPRPTAIDGPLHEWGRAVVCSRLLDRLAKKRKAASHFAPPGWQAYLDRATPGGRPQIHTELRASRKHVP